MLRAHRRELAESGKRAPKAPPVTIESLRKMIDGCDPATPTSLRVRVVLVLGLAMMGRRSELVVLELSDVRETADGLEVLCASRRPTRTRSALRSPFRAAATPTLTPFAW